MRASSNVNDQDILHWYKTPDEMEFTDKGFPILEPCLELSNFNFVPFHCAKTAGSKYCYVHFYEQDYLFNRIWYRPERYIEMLSKFSGIVMPDFSLYYDMPKPLQEYNHYRNLWFARMCQMKGMSVIPNARWAKADSYDYCFEGLPKNSIIFVSAKGCIQNKDFEQDFYDGFEEALKRLTPKMIILGTTKKAFPRILEKVKPDCEVKLVEFLAGYDIETVKEDISW